MTKTNPKTQPLDWIKVKEQLPNQGDAVEVKGEGMMAKLIYLNKKFISRTGTDWTPFITHWRYGIENND